MRNTHIGSWSEREAGSDVSKRPGTNSDDPDLEAAAEALGASVSEDDVRSALRNVIDPEMGLNIVDLGLIYDIQVYGNEVLVQMTLTSPNCPMGPEIVSGAKAAAESVDGVSDAEIDLVWEPYWTSERIDARIRAYMGL